MTIPYEPNIFGTSINVHLILEYLAFFVGFRYYIFLRKRTADHISSPNRLAIILGAVVGALLGSRLFGYLENPILSLDRHMLLQLLNAKTIMGGLFGGLIGVEIAKKIIGESHSSGDLFTFPLILGIFIGRIGCFLSGVNEFTYGSETSFFGAMNLGDGLQRHPTSLYELIFLFALFIFLQRIKATTSNLASGDLFKIFMISYFGFRFLIEFIKPNVFFTLGLSSIQWLCILCWVYYYKSFLKFFSHAYSKIYLL